MAESKSAALPLGYAPTRRCEYRAAALPIGAPRKATISCSNDEKPCQVSLSRDKRSRRPGSALWLSEADLGTEVTHLGQLPQGDPRSRRGRVDDPLPACAAIGSLCGNMRCAVSPRERFKMSDLMTQPRIGECARNC